MSECVHVLRQHKFINGDIWKKCAKCGKVWKPDMPIGPTLILAGNHQQYVEFLKSRGINPYLAQSESGTRYYEGGGAVAGVHFDRIIVTGTFRQRDDAHNIFEYSRACLAQGGKVTYNDLEHGWTANKFDLQGDVIIRDASSNLRCNWCRGRTSETYRHGVCYVCLKGKPKMAKHPMMKPEGQFQTDYNGNVIKKPALMPIVHVRKEGDIWKLPKGNSPMWTEQWAYQGSAKSPYIISKKEEGHTNGSTTSDGWACGCPSFTRNTPRTPCKHILNVMLKEGLGKVKPTAAKMASVDDKKLAEFEKWQREQAMLKAGNKPTAGANAKLNLFGATTRKFR